MIYVSRRIRAHFKKWMILPFFILLQSCESKKITSPTTPVEKGDVDVSVSLSGNIKPYRETLITAPYTGYVRKLYVKIGDRVKAGDPLVSFSPNLSDQETTYPIRAAYPALVTQLQKMEGDYLVTGGKDNNILKVEDNSKIFVESDVPEADITKIKNGQSAKVKVNALPEKEFKGEIVQIFQSSRDSDNPWDRKGGTFPVRVQILDPIPELKTGLSAIVEIIVNKSEGVLRIPQEYIQREGDKSYVFTLKGERKPVELGLRSDRFVEIKSGVQEGEVLRQPEIILDAGADD